MINAINYCWLLLKYCTVSLVAKVYHTVSVLILEVCIPTNQVTFKAYSHHTPLCRVHSGRFSLDLHLFDGREIALVTLKLLQVAGWIWRILHTLCTSYITHSCLEILTNVVWTFYAFQYNFGINHNFIKYLKESCGLDFDRHFSLKYFLKLASLNPFTPGLDAKGEPMAPGQ